MSCHLENIKNRMKTLKSNFSAAKDILNSSGFRFNNSTQRIEAETSEWETYIKVKYVFLFHAQVVFLLTP